MKSKSKTRLVRSEKELRIYYKPRGSKEEEEMMRITRLDEQEQQVISPDSPGTKQYLKECDEIHEELDDFMETVTRWNQDMRKRFGIVLQTPVGGSVKSSSVSSRFPVPQTPYPNARSVETRRRAREILLQCSRKPPPRTPPSLSATDSMKTLYSKQFHRRTPEESFEISPSLSESRSEASITVTVKHGSKRPECNHTCEHFEKSPDWLTTPDRDIIKMYFLDE